MKRVVFIVLFVFVSLAASADRVRVRLYSNNTVDRIYISFDLGEYNLVGDAATEIESGLGEGRTVDLAPTKGRKVRVLVDDHVQGDFDSVMFMATDTACILCLNPPNLKNRTYEGNLIVKVNKSGKLLLINDVEFETYLAGVVQSEIYGNDPSIFRVQAIISRTWALRNINKHKAEGYNFCDQVHCQAYLNRCVRPDIMLGTIQSCGETIVDAEGNLIETPFHANSGGQTANSEDVWRSALPYLRSVQDTFSNRMKQSEWVKSISEDKWLNYFANKHKLNTADDSVRQQLLTFAQGERKARICNVPLTRIRTDFQLKSTFFSVIYDSIRHQVTLAGHGYGHGVGLSQEGTIRMVGLGISYDSIIRHYYSGSKINYDPEHPHTYVENYVKQITQIIEEDRNRATQVRSKKDDWLGRLFRLRDREEREEVYDPNNADLDSDWQYDW